MPTYEYVCRSCGEGLEVVQSFRDDALTVCPRCGGELRKVFGSVGIVFKGSGFYKNDSRNSSTGSRTLSTEPSTTEHHHEPSTPPASTEAAKPAESSSTSPAPAAAPATTTP